MEIIFQFDKRLGTNWLLNKNLETISNKFEICGHFMCLPSETDTEKAEGNDFLEDHIFYPLEVLVFQLDLRL